MKYFLVISTTSSLKEARKIADVLLKKKLAACIQLIPAMESHYVWKGKRERSKEVLILIKTKASLYQKLEIAIRKIHSYETPEIIALPIQKGNQAYFKWISDSTS